MAFENMTYENILNRMVEHVTSSYPDLDTREGSILFNALAPAAMELAIAYSELDNVLAESFVETASREYLYVACEQIGMDVSMLDAHQGTFMGEFDVEVPIGSRWNCELFNYTVENLIEKDSATNYYKYEMLCETAGAEPNTVKGSLTAITDFPSDLTHAELTECLVEGEDELSEDEIRSLYYDFINSTASDGNVGQYERWCSEYDGIGNYKIFPLWNGSNTVKVSILSSSNKAASETLVSDFQTYLDPLDQNGKPTGMGDGKAPIGAFVTVSTATEVPISVTANIKLSEGFSSVPDIDTILSEYLSSIAYKKQSIPYMNIGAVILSVDGIDSISNLKINNTTSDITLGNEEIPVLGETNWTVTG